jgi:hypothetical protein
MFFSMLIDGQYFGNVGNGTGGARVTYDTSTFIVPAGSTYRLNGSNATKTYLQQWREAKMPLAVASGDSMWTDVDGDAVLETDGKKLTIDANVAELGAKARITTDTNSLELKVGSGSLPEMIINSDGAVGMGDTALFQANGAIKFSTLGDAAGVPNFHIGASGYVYRSTTTMYSAEETETAIDKKLAIKDKLIEKLSARLDKLEKRIK